MKSIYKPYGPKTILNTHKHVDGGWFWDKYSAFPYAGCEWGCAYCYWRDEKYNPHKISKDKDVSNFEDAFSQYIKIKEGADLLLKKALVKKPKDIIYLDNYQPVDTKYSYTHKLLKVVSELNFPVFINEKSPMVLNDLDIIKDINAKSYVNVGFSIITAKDNAARKLFENKAPSVKSRFAAMKELSENKILTGTIFMPVLPYIYDNEKNIESVVKKTRESGGQYILEGSLTLQGYCKTYFYKALRKYDPSLIDKYGLLYQDNKLFSKHLADIHNLVLRYCRKYELTPYIPRPVNFYPEKLRVNKKIAEIFYRNARELQLSGQSGYKEWAYRKAAWSLDDLKENIEKIYQEKGISGLLQIQGVGKSLAAKIKRILKQP